MAFASYSKLSSLHSTEVSVGSHDVLTGSFLITAMK